MTGEAEKFGVRGAATGRGSGRGCGGRLPTYAALDLGSNNCRLLVARPAGRGFRVVDAFSRIVRLGEGVGASGILSDAAIARTVGALKVCAKKMRRRGVTSGRSVATEACRRASNCGTFLDRVKSETGLELEIISVHEEARLALAGVLPLLDADTPYAFVFDIGGGSTELIWLSRDGGDANILASLSIPCGVVNFAERYGGDRISAGVYAAMVGEVESLLRDFERVHGVRDKIAAGQVQMLGTSGTVTTIASIHLGLCRYDRSTVDGMDLAVGDIETVNRRLKDMDCDARAALPCVGRERADLVVAGSAILEALCRTWPSPTIRVADRGLREGILLGLMNGAGAGSPR